MKKLGKLSISPEKIMKNEDLINLQGGYDALCGCYDNTNDVIWGSGYCGGYTSCSECGEALSVMYGWEIWCVHM